MVEVAIAACVVAMFGLVAYRTSRSRFAGYWVLTIASAGTGSALYLANGSPSQWILNPLGNGLSVLSASFIWAAARALAGRSARWWAIVIGSAAAVGAGLADDPRGDVWSGGAVMLFLVTGYLSAATVELVRARRGAPQVALRSGSDDGGEGVLRGILAAGSAALSGYYVWRLFWFLVAGPESASFERFAGTAPTTVALILTMVIISFVMTTMTQLERTRDLRDRVMHDGLTGVLSRGEFMSRTEALAAHAARYSQACVAAGVDVDHFKNLNDTRGHAAGDLALARIGEVWRGVGRSSDLIGRIGGDEFAILLCDTDVASGRAVLKRLADAYAAGGGEEVPTLSIGVAALNPGQRPLEAFDRADRALYEAKRAGRGRISIADEGGFP